jgi:DeoR/GlpR family transcriptional regulator of sugar metabolism
MSQEKKDWERRLMKVLLPLVTSEEELTLEALKDMDYPGNEHQLREDLYELESYGMIRESRIGDGFVAKRPGESALAKRKQQCPFEKRLIGVFVGNYLKGISNVAIAIDGGTTNLEIIQVLLNDELKGKPTWRVLITNNLEALSIVAEELAKIGIDGTHWIGVGGELRPSRGTFFGALAVGSMDRYSPGIAVIGVNGVGFPNSLQTEGGSEISLKQKMIEKTVRMVIFPVDSSKWGLPAGIEIADLDEIVKQDAKEVIFATCYPKRQWDEEETQYENRTKQFIHQFSQFISEWRQLYQVELESHQIINMEVIEPSTPYNAVFDIEEHLREEAEALQLENQYDAGLAISVHIKPRQFGGVGTDVGGVSTSQVVDEFTSHVDNIQDNSAFLRLRGETDGELQDFGLEYPLHELKAQIPDVRVGMMLKCQVKDNGKDVSLHFETFTPRLLPLERRKALQKKYVEMFKDFDDEESV